MMLLSVSIERRLRANHRDFSLDVHFESDAEITVLFGPSGAGKTLTLQSIAGLLRPQRGLIRLGDRVLFDSAASIEIPARHRGLGFVFQEYALFPHLTVLENVAFALPKSSWQGRAHAPQRQQLLNPFELDELADMFPSQLSGGQRQRVALARALAARPQWLLLDEPFAALDRPLRERMRRELLEVRQRHSVPMIVITHDPDDVAALGGTLVCLQGGRVVPGAAESTA